MTSFRERPIVWLLAAVAAAITLGTIVGPFYPPHPQALDANMQDTGAILSMTRELLKGSALYEKIYTPYGPVPHALYEELASTFGNTPVTYAGFVALLSAVALALGFILVRRHMPLALALGFYILVLSHFSNFEIIYSAFEAVGIILLAIFWAPPEDRSPVRCVLYGAILSVIHFSKFGSDVVAAAAFVLLDLIYLIRASDKLSVLRALVNSGLILSVSFLAIFAVAALIIIERLPTAVAKDTLLPLYLGASYSRFVGEYRYPYYIGILYFTKIHLPMLLGLAACVAAVSGLTLGWNFPTEPHDKRERRGDGFAYPLLLPPLFFILACFVLLKHAWHYNQYGIYAALGCSLFFCAFGANARRATIMLLVPYLFITGWIALRSSLGIRARPAMVVLHTPVGCPLEGSPELVAFYQRLFAVLNEEIRYSDATSRIAVFTDRPGIYYFSGLPIVGRITWYLPAYLRPWEIGQEEGSLAHAGAILVGVPARPASNPRLLEVQVRHSLQVICPPDLIDFMTPRMTNPICIGRDPSEDQVVVWAFATTNGEKASRTVGPIETWTAN